MNVYTNKQNARHFLQAMLYSLGGPVVQPPDCPASRWASLCREASRSVPQYSTKINEMVRRPYGKNKRMTFSWTEE